MDFNRKNPFLTDRILLRGREVVRLEIEALELLKDTLGDEFISACEALAGLSRQLVITGMGKSGHIARKVAATFAATGTPAIYIHPSEAGHGDLGMLVQGDVLLVFSNSGNTAELRPILSFASRAGIPIIGVASRTNSLVTDMADIALLLPNVREACTSNIAPTTSSTMQLALGDALAMTVMDMRGISNSQLRKLHPAGMIGLSLVPVSDLMHGVDHLPLARADMELCEVISIITAGHFGLVGLTDEDGALTGIITDGDLRRNFDKLGTAKPSEVMTPAPKLLPAEMPAGDALAFLNENKITAAFIVKDTDDASRRPLGIIHIHDLLRHGLN